MSRKQSERLTIKDILLSKKDAPYFDEMYTKQLNWTKSTRNYIYRQINLLKAQVILEVGSGTGALLKELVSVSRATDIIGIDINPIAVEFCEKNNHTTLVHGDGNYLPFQENSCDITICNYLLLWLENPIQVMKELFRVTKPGGWVVCLAEPDYKGRIDHPYGDLWKKLYYSSLSAHDPDVGRKLAQIFSKVNLKAQIGLQSIPQVSDTVKKLYNNEIKMLEKFVPEKSRPLLEEVRLLIEKTDPSEMMSFMPVFYAFAKKV